MKELNSPMDWNHPSTAGYEQKISLKIPGYLGLYDMMERIMTAQLARSKGADADAHVLVIGAGGGQELVTLGARQAKWSFTGVDPSGPMVLAAQRRIEEAELQERVRLVTGEIDSIADDELFTAATCMLVLNFVKGNDQKRQLLRSIAERLQDGAPFVLATINGRLGTKGFSLQMQAWKSHMLANGISLLEWNNFESSMGKESDPIPVNELENLLRDAGFEHITRFFGAYLIDGLFAVKRTNGVPL